MSKKKHQKRTWSAKIQRPQDLWVTEDEAMKGDFSLVQKLHPETTIEESLQSLVSQGFLEIRTTPSGKRQYRPHHANMQAAINKLPPEMRRGDLDLEIHESIAIICDYDNATTTLLSLIIKQTNTLTESHQVPWISKTHEQLIRETLGEVKQIPQAFATLEQRGFIEITANGPQQYRYRLNTPVVQAAIDALPIREDGSEDQLL